MLYASLTNELNDFEPRAMPGAVGADKTSRAESATAVATGWGTTATAAFPMAGAPADSGINGVEMKNDLPRGFWLATMLAVGALLALFVGATMLGISW